MNIGGNQEHWRRWGWVLGDTFLNALDDNNRRTEIEITDQMCWSACIICNDWLTSKYLIARPQSCQKCDTIGRLNKATKTNFVYCPRSGQCGSQPPLPDPFHPSAALPGGHQTIQPGLLTQGGVVASRGVSKLLWLFSQTSEKVPTRAISLLKASRGTGILKHIKTY